MGDVVSKIGDGLWNAFLMAWQVWWALVLGFAISAIVQAWVPRERIERALSGDGLAPIAKATGLGAASSSCSYAAIAIAKSPFQKGASAASALAFQFAVAEYLGGLVMIALMRGLLRLFVSRRAEDQARAHARDADAGHRHHMAGGEVTWRDRLTSRGAWVGVAHNFRRDWQMLYKEIIIGFLLAGFISLLGDDFFNGLFLQDSPAAVQTIWGAFIGPVIAVLIFVCSVGNVPLAAVLWSGGISFAGVMAFIFADLIVLPIVAAYRKYAFTQVLDDHGVLASIGTVGDAFDNALAEGFIDSFKTELITDRVWRTRTQLELAIVEYGGWFNAMRLHEALGGVPPVEFEHRHAAKTLDSDNGSVAVLSPRPADRLSAARLERERASDSQTALSSPTDPRPASPASIS